MSENESERGALLAAHQFAPKYPVVCSCGFSAGFAMDSETPWLHHVAYLLREAGFTPDDERTADLRITTAATTEGGLLEAECPCGEDHALNDDGTDRKREDEA